MGVVKLGCSEEGVCELQLADWLELQHVLKIKVVNAYSLSYNVVTKQRKRLWRKLGLSEEEIKVLKIIRQKHALYERYLNLRGEYMELLNEFNALKEFLSDSEIEEYKSKLRHLHLQAKAAFNSYRKRIERINNYRKALEKTFESFRPLHSLPVVVVKSILRPLLKELDLYLFMEMFRTVKRLKKQYAIVVKSYAQTLELANDLILQKFFECIENEECDNQWKLKMKALQHVAMKYPERFVDNVSLIYEIVDAKPNSELLVHILTS
jgi:predicted nucleic acid-binding protein